ncbi:MULTISPECIES: hypothetical protein [Enterobacterales]
MEDSQSVSTTELRKRYALDELIDECDLDAPKISEEQIWGLDESVGNEEW